MNGSRGSAVAELGTTFTNGGLSFREAKEVQLDGCLGFEPVVAGLDSVG